MRDAPTAVIYDLDSTIADTRHRWHLSPFNDPASDWDAYAKACADDGIIAGTLARMHLDWPHHQVHICSGRSAAAEEATRGWLDRHGARYDHLSLRASTDTAKNAERKIAYVRQLQTAGVQVVLFYEDWPAVAEQIGHTTGVPVMVINPCYEMTDIEGRGLGAVHDNQDLTGVLPEGRVAQPG